MPFTVRTRKSSCGGGGGGASSTAATLLLRGSGAGGSSSSSFARLPDAAARRLHSLALRNLRDEGGQSQEHADADATYADAPSEAARELEGVDEGGWWTVPEELGSSTSSGIEFLPLRIDFQTTATAAAAAVEDFETTGETRTIYCSYNGGSAASVEGADDGDVIELDPSLLHPSLSDPNRPTAQVSVHPLHMIKDATSIQIEPLTPSDWELLEVHATDLEEGGLLRQVSVVYPNQVLPVRLGISRDDVAMVKVLPGGFGAAQEEEEGEEAEEEYEDDYDDDDWDYDDFYDASSTDSDDSSLPAQRRPMHECLRLVADTEVIVVPKTRQSAAGAASKPPQSDEYAQSRPLRVLPTERDFSTEMKDLLLSSSSPLGCDDSSSEGGSIEGGNLLECPAQFTAVAHPSTLMELVPGWREVTGRQPTSEASSALAILRRTHRRNSRSPKGSRVTRAAAASNRSRQEFDDSSSLTIARVYPSARVPRGHVAMHTNLRYQLGITPLYDYACLQLILDTRVEKSYKALKKLTRSEEVTINLKAIDRIIPTPFRNPAKPWRHPTIASTKHPHHPVPASPVRKNDSSHHGGINSFLSYLTESCGGKEDVMPLSSGSLITLPFNSSHQDRGKETTYKLIFELKDRHCEHLGEDNTYSPPDADRGSILPTSVVFVPHLSSLFSVNGDWHGPGRIVRETTESFSSSQDGESVCQPQNEPMMSMLPSNADCINDAVAESASIARNLWQDMAIASRARKQRTTSGLLIAGEKGSGKTHLALSTAAQLRMRRSCATIYLDCKKLQSSSELRMRSVLSELTDVFAEADRCRPSIVLLDDLDVLVPNVESGTGDEDGTIHHHQISPALVSQVKILCNHIHFLMGGVAKNLDGGAVAIVGTCKDQSSVAPTLRSTRTFSKAVGVPTLTASQRRTLFDATLAHLCFDEMESKVMPMTSVAQFTPAFGKKSEGFRPCDLVGLASRVAHTAHIHSLGRKHNSDNALLSESVVLGVSESNLLDALSNFTPISHQGLHVENQSSPRSWSSIGGLFRAKEALTDVMLQPVRYNLIFRNSPISLPKGLLLYGPPGCGKTFMLPALAQECGFNLVTCRGPELLDKYIGASEAKVRQLFARAYAASPSILFLDDFDALAPRRGTDHTGVTDRVVNQLLTFLDGVESSGNERDMVYIIAATSRPDKIDPALLRPGRLEKHIYVGYPESRDEWNDLFLKVSATRDVAGDVEEFISSGALLQSFWNNLKHIKAFSAADMKAVYDTAHLASVHEFLKSSRGGQHNASEAQLAIDADPAAEERVPLNQVEVHIRKRHLIDALRATRPSLSSADRRLLAGIYKPFYSSQEAHGTAAAMPPLGDFDHADGDFASGPHVPTAQPLKTTLR